MCDGNCDEIVHHSNKTFIQIFNRHESSEEKKSLKMIITTIMSNFCVKTKEKLPANN